MEEQQSANPTVEDELIAIEEVLGAFYLKRLANTCNRRAGLALLLQLLTTTKTGLLLIAIK